MFMKTDYPSVLLIYTGGTIGMIENPETGALENFNFDHLLKHVPELKRFNYRISSYQFDPPIDSSDMEPSLWAKIVKDYQLTIMLLRRLCHSSWNRYHVLYGFCSQFHA